MKKTNLGIMGLGNRAKGCIKHIMRLPNVNISAICDVYPARIAETTKFLVENNNEKPFETDNYHQILSKPDIHAVIIYTSWEPHIQISIDAMKAGKCVAVDVGGAYSLEDCWKLVHTYEETKNRL